MEHTYTLAHVGVHLNSAEEANKTAELLSTIFNLQVRQGKKSFFAGDYFECMREPFLGKNGHIAMMTDDLAAAVDDLKQKGFGFREETAAYSEDGVLSNIYLDGEFGGFAIHIMRKK